MDKEKIYGAILVLVILLGVCLVIKHLDNLGKEQHKKDVEEYRQCIIDQSEKQGWIIRSYCSLNYSQLDKEAGLEYTQSGYDLYLKK